MPHFGLDISSNNPHPINAAAAYRHLRDLGGEEPFLVIKITESTGYVNPEAAMDLAAFRNAGFKAVAGYLFDHGGADPGSEWRFAQAHSLGLPLFFDIEDPQGLSAAQYAAHARSLVAYDSQGLEYLNQAEVAEGFPADRLWLAEYNKQPGVTKYRCLVHQYDDAGTIPGVAGTFDLNVWMGSELQFDQFFHLGTPFVTPAPPAAGPFFAALAPTHDNKGYWLVESDLSVWAKGSATGGNQKGRALAKPVIGAASSPLGGFWAASGNGGVFAEQGAPFDGSEGGTDFNGEVTAIASSPSGRGYWLATAVGGVFSFGDAAFHGAVVDKGLKASVVGMAATPDSGGYWLATSDGGVFALGNAQFYGSMGGQHLGRPVTAIIAHPSGKGYWLVSDDGGVFTFGAARFAGSLGGHTPASPVRSAAGTSSGNGYWLMTRAGGVYSFGDAHFAGAGI